MIKVIFFDLGGVIFQDFFSGGAEFFAQKFHLPVKQISKAYQETDSALYCKDEVTDKQRWENFAEKIGISSEKVPVFIQAFYESYQLFPKSVHLLTKLKQEYPTIELGILSDQPLDVAKYLRKKFPDVFGLFDTDITLISAEIGMSKKDPDLKIYEEAIKRSNHQPENILFVDNSEYNLQNAKRLGMQVFLFDTTAMTIDKLSSELEKLL